jgi:hypothetical protein
MDVRVCIVTHLEEVLVLFPVNPVLHIAVLIEFQQHNAVGPVLDRRSCHVNLRFPV